MLGLSTICPVCVTYAPAADEQMAHIGRPYCVQHNLSIMNISSSEKGWYVVCTLVGYATPTCIEFNMHFIAIDSEQYCHNYRAGDCGFGSFPTFGTHALKYTWQFDFELTYVGVGMLVSALLSTALCAMLSIPFHQRSGTVHLPTFRPWSLCVSLSISLVLTAANRWTHAV